MRPAVSQPIRIGSVHRIRHFPYWATLAQGITSRAVELGVVLCEPTQDADIEWERPCVEVLQQQPDVIVLPHSVDETFPQVEPFFRAAGVPVVGVETAPRAAFAGVVRADEAQGATLAVTELFMRLDGQGQVANLSGGPTDRQREFARQLAQHPQIELVYEQIGDWTRAAGAHAMRAALDVCPGLRGVFAHNDQMALGALDVISARGRQGEIVVVGFDADADALRMIHTGDLAATIYRGLYDIGRTALELALRVAQGEPIPPETRFPATLITAANLAETLLDTVELLPGLLHDLVESANAHRRLQQETIALQQRLIGELSSPVIPISDELVVVPLIGVIDSVRAQQITRTLLEAVSQRHAHAILVDVTGIAVVDRTVAAHLLRAARAVQLLGAQVILVGIRPEVAQTLIALGADMGDLVTRATVQAGLAYATRRTGVSGRF